jgi:type I restriction enzyme S subunit
LKNKAEYIEKMSSGSTFSEASATVMRSVTISLPPLPEQQAIAAVLSSFDDKIELLREENKTLEATAQGIFKEWFGKYKVDDELPKGWRVGKLGEEFDILMGQSPAGESYNENKE